MICLIAINIIYSFFVHITFFLVKNPVRQALPGLIPSCTIKVYYTRSTNQSIPSLTLRSPQQLSGTSSRLLTERSQVQSLPGEGPLKRVVRFVATRDKSKSYLNCTSVSCPIQSPSQRQQAGAFPDCSYAFSSSRLLSSNNPIDRARSNRGLGHFGICGPCSTYGTCGGLYLQVVFPSFF